MIKKVDFGDFSWIFTVVILLLLIGFFLFSFYFQEEAVDNFCVEQGFNESIKINLVYYCSNETSITKESVECEQIGFIKYNCKFIREKEEISVFKK